MKQKKYILSIMTLLLTLLLSFQMVQAAVTTENIGTDTYKNCVLYVRSRVPSLPYGLNTYQDKVNIINSYTPKVGSVAIIKVASNSSGHVAVVTSVNGTTVAIEESNWGSTLTRRTGTASELNITGYFQP